MGPALLHQGPERGKGSYPGASEGQGMLSTVFGFQPTWFLVPPVVTRTMDIITDHSCSRNTNSDIPSAAAQAQMPPGPQWQPRPWDTDMISDGCPDSWHLFSLWWQPDLDCFWTIDMDHGSSPGLDDIMALCGISGHPDKWQLKDCIAQSQILSWYQHSTLPFIILDHH